MMRPKGKLFALLAIFVAIGLITATGAFTTVTAERTANVTVAGDADALLALEPHNGANGEAYANLNDDNQLEISLTGEFGGGTAGGVNADALTEVDNVFNITNQGADTVYIYIEKVGGNASLVNFYSGSVQGTNSGTNITSSTGDNNEQLSSGTTIEVSMEIDTRGTDLGDDDEILSDMIIHANTTDPST